MNDPYDDGPHPDVIIGTPAHEPAVSRGVAYWRTRPMAERLTEIERLRRVAFGDATLGRLKRVIEVVRRDDDGEASR